MDRITYLTGQVLAGTISNQPLLRALVETAGKDDGESVTLIARACVKQAVAVVAELDRVDPPRRGRKGVEL